MSFLIKDFSDIKKLSEGGMGSVYLATQLSLNRKVVIKELASNLHNDPQLIKRFENEAKSAAALNHENIIRVFDFGEDRKSFFITMEYIDGWNLNQIMHWQPFRKEIGLMILVQAMKGLNYAHKHGTVHCDIKPGNILVSKTGSVKVVDFGLARASAQTADSNDKSSIFITPSYVPPEVASGIGNQDIFTDIWSMGVLAYRIICGRLPFVAEDVRKLVYSIVHEKEKDIQMIFPALPDDLAESIRGCLQKNPKDRITSLDPVIESLENFIYDLGVRDIEKMIMNYVSNRHSVEPELVGMLLQYHMQKGNEYFDAGNDLKSDVHFREAEKYGVLDQDFKASKISRASRGRFTGPYRQRTSRPQAGRSIIPSLGIFTKSKSIKRKISIIGIISFVSLCTASAFLIVQKTQPSASKAVLGTMKASGYDSIAPKETGVVSGAPDSDKELNPGFSVLNEELTSVDKYKSIKTTSAGKTNTQIPPKTGQNDRLSANPGAGKKSGVLKLSIEPSYADVTVDGEKVQFDQLSGGKRLKAGRHMITVTADGYSGFNNILTIEPNAAKLVSISLRRQDNRTGLLHVHTYPWAELYIDSIFEGSTPTPKPISLAAGEHSLVLKRDGYRTYTSTIHVDQGEETRIKIQLEP